MSRLNYKINARNQTACNYATFCVNVIDMQMKVNPNELDVKKAHFNMLQLETYSV